MTDDERAVAWVSLASYEAPEIGVTRLADAFAAVRADERARIVAWLRGPARIRAMEIGGDTIVYPGKMERRMLADAIERGEATAPNTPDRGP